MGYYWYQLIFFTFISSLASAQWDSDRFLFEEPTTIARPKANREPNREKTREAQPSKIKLEEPIKPVAAIHPESSDAVKKSTEMEIDRRSVLIDALFGQCDLNSSGLEIGGPVPRRSFGLGVKLYIPIDDSISVRTHFWSAPNLGRDASTAKNQQLRLDQFGIDLSFASQQLFMGIFNWGLYAEQVSIWGSNELEQSNAVQTNIVGVSGIYAAPKQGRWASNFELKIGPVLFTNQQRLRGSSVSVNWNSGLALEGGKSFLLGLGLESNRFNSTGVDQKSMVVNQLQILIGYRISTSSQR